MPAYNASNIDDHPMESYGQLKTSVENLQKEIDQLKNHSHGTAGSDIPDPTKHKYISFAKSAVRIAAGIALVWPGSLVLAGLFLIVAEVLGIAEEMV